MCLLAIGMIMNAIILSLVGAAGAAPQEEWRKSFKKDVDGSFQFVRQTKDGGYIIASTIIDANSYDKKSKVYDARLIKTDKNGEKQWSKTFEGNADDAAVSVIELKDGYIVLGWTNSYGAGSTDVWLIKVDLNGVQQWSRTIGGINNDKAFSIQQTADDGYILAGYTMSGGYQNGWLIKTDINGFLQWNRTFEGKTYLGRDSHLVFTNVKQTEDGGYILVAMRRLIKTDANGNEQWNRMLSKLSINEQYFVNQTSDGGYMIIGMGDEEMDSINKVWLIKTNPEGEEQWNKTSTEGTKEDGMLSSQFTFDGGYIIAGETKSTSSEDTAAQLIKIDVNGNEQWNKKFERGFSSNVATSVWQTSDGGYIVTVQESIGDNLLIKIESTGVDATPSAVKTTEIKKTPETTPTEAIKTPEVIPTEVIKTPIVSPTETNKPVGQSTPGFGLLAAVFSVFMIFIIKIKKARKKEGRN